jgi:uncharacterized protein YwqG/predicted DNA-binding protein (MmcQ/YjbR family)
MVHETETNALIQRLLAHCQRKPGAQKGWDYSDEHPYFNILGGFLDNFASFFLGETPPVLVLRCPDAERERLAQHTPSIRVSGRMFWETQGWTWTDIDLDGTLSEVTLLSLIDQSYRLVYDSEIDTNQKHEIELVAQQLSQQEILDDLITWYGLAHHRQEIQQAVGSAVLLKTYQAEESQLALGQSKIGGLPDLPTGWAWPHHHSGKSLAFLAQVNLAEVQACIYLEELPASGILYFFSVYGWQDEGSSDPQVPNERSEVTWTQVLFAPDTHTPLQRRAFPIDVNSFRAARVDILPVITLPDGQEMAIQTYNWSKEELKAFDWGVANSFKTVRNYTLGHPADHLLLGYANYMQNFVDIVAKYDLQLLFQLASDRNTDMGWGDGGLIYFWIRPEDLNRRDFSRIFVDYQCG